MFPDKAKYVQYQSHSKGVMQTQDEATLTSGADQKGNYLFADRLRDNYILDNASCLGEVKAILK